ncbi:MAG: MmgE/PrpD family protein [Hyphomicrobiales bacterium]|nr:MmgE/PrpD family protein [Hyphomicrobiales bacterium]
MNVVDKSIHAGRRGTISGRLADFALDLTFDAIPERIRERAKYLMLDAIGIAYASQGFPFADAAMAAISSLSSGEAAVIGYGRKLAMRDAALVNGLLAHGLDYDDTHSPGVIHATASSLPLALALGDRLKLSGRDFLCAYIAAMEASTRLGSVAKGGFHQVGFHPTGLIGIFGCALAAARMIGLTRDQAVMAQGIALSMAAGSLEFLEDGAWTKRMHPGWAASSAITAATMAKHGFIGPGAAYEGRFGLFASHLGPLMDNADLALSIDGLGQVWQIDEVAIKPIPACHFTHAAADAAIALSNAVKGADIRSVRVLVPAEVIKTVCEPEENKKAPANSYDAQFSIPYIVATGLLRGRFTLDELEDKAIADHDVLTLAQRVNYAADPASTFPKHYTGEVIVTLNDGRTIRHREGVNRGCSDRPLSNAEIEAKYFDNACRLLPRARADIVRDAVVGVDSGSTTALADILAHPAK